MYFNRYEAKLAAKSSMGRAQPSYMVVMLVYLLLTTGLTTLVMTLIGVPWDNVVTYIQRGYTPEEVFDYLILRQIDRVAMACVAEFFLSLFCAVMEFGLFSYTLRLARNEGAGTANLFDGFARAGRVLWLNVLIWLLSVLWGLLGMVPGVLIMAVGIYQQNFEIIMGSTFFLWVGGAAMAVWVGLRYTLAFYYLLDDPACTARQAIRRSKEAMVGHKAEALALEFSFFGWLLLAGLIQTVLAAVGMEIVGTVAAGALQLWLIPYIFTTKANFYDYVMSCKGGSARPAAGYAGPEYDYHSSDGTEPF